MALRLELTVPDWSLRRFPEEPIYSSGPGIYRPGPRIYSPGRIRESSDTESGRENRSGGRVDRFLARIYRSATPVIHPKRPIRNAFDRHLGHSRYLKRVPAARRAGPAKCVSRCIQKTAISSCHRWSEHLSEAKHCHRQKFGSHRPAEVAAHTIADDAAAVLEDLKAGRIGEAQQIAAIGHTWKRYRCR